VCFDHHRWRHPTGFQRIRADGIPTDTSRVASDGPFATTSSRQRMSCGRSRPAPVEACQLHEGAASARHLRAPTALKRSSPLGDRGYGWLALPDARGEGSSADMASGGPSFTLPTPATQTRCR
jgi:hypothetical protein